MALARHSPTSGGNDRPHSQKQPGREMVRTERTETMLMTPALHGAQLPGCTAVDSVTF